MKVCKSCKKELTLSNFGKSKNVKDGYENICKECRLEQRKKYINICDNCGEKFKTAYKNAKYCSQGCKPQSKRKRVVIKCSYCKKEKEVTLSHSKMYKNLYCSNDCKNNHYRELYSGKNSHRYNKKEIKCETCGKLVLRTSYEIHQYHHHYCSEGCKSEAYKKLFMGKNNPNYDESKTDEERVQNRNIEGYQEWLIRVYEKDNYTCRCCGDNTGGNLNAHHIYNYSQYKELRTNINNGITFCNKCHKKYHDIYGYRDNNLKQLQDFFLKYGNTVPSFEGNFIEGVETR